MSIFDVSMQDASICIIGLQGITNIVISDDVQIYIDLKSPIFRKKYNLLVGLYCIMIIKLYFNENC